MKPRVNIARDAEIARLYVDEHWRVPHLAAQFGVDRQRIYQILRNELRRTGQSHLLRQPGIDLGRLPPMPRAVSFDTMLKEPQG